MSVTGEPIVALANHFRFGPGEVVGPRAAASRMLLWTRGGTGTLTVGRQQSRLGPGDVFVLPWKRSVKISSSRDHPLEIGGAHIIPRINIEDEMEWRVAHGPEEPLFHTSARQDVRWTQLDDGAVQVRGERARDLISLGEIAVRRFFDSEPSLPLMRSLAIVMVSTITAPGSNDDNDALPQTLRSAQEYCLAHLASAISSRELANAVGISESALARQFRAFSSMSPQGWLREQRLRRASEMLRSSTLRIGEVARLVGFRDPLHFSRVFAARFGMSPREFAKSARPL
ncbi:MAG: helix-turn-helix transcriptional regulator [Actinobacteria bacterium]|nr:helix-turn-helix transcriptional regulator [Actinomycetota bacterium]